MNKINENIKQKTDSPPYLSISSLEKILSILSSRKLGEINASYLSAQRFSKFDVGIAIVALKFLGLIDKDCKTTDLTKKLQLQGKPKEEALQTMIRNAYAKIFSVIESPQNLSNQELSNEFIAQYNLSPRLAKSAVPVFQWLCGEAGLIDKSAVPNSRKRAFPTILSKKQRGDKQTIHTVISQPTLAIQKTTKLDIIKDFVQKLDLQNTEVDKIKNITLILQGLLDSVKDSPTETETNPIERTL